MLTSSDHRIRAYAARVAGIWADDLLPQAVRDPHPRVRLESVVAATYIRRPDAIQIVTSALDQPRDAFLDYAIRASARALQPLWAKPFTKNQLTFESDTQQTYLKSLLGDLPHSVSPGEEVYTMACMTCHQPEGKGLPGVYPPLAGSAWTNKIDPARLIKIVLHGLTGPIKVNDQIYGDKPNSVPMPPMGGLSDQQIADVLTYLRKDTSPVTIEKVKTVREETNSRAKPWTAADLDN
jgi:mono/diheme cytochrome c family protein